MFHVRFFMGNNPKDKLPSSEGVKLGIKRLKDWISSKNIKEFLKERKANTALATGLALSIGAGAVAALTVGGCPLALAVASWGSGNLANVVIFGTLWDEIKKRIMKSTHKKNLTDKEIAELILKLDTSQLQDILNYLYQKFKDDDEIKNFLKNVVQEALLSDEFLDMFSDEIGKKLIKKIRADLKELKITLGRIEAKIDLGFKTTAYKLDRIIDIISFSKEEKKSIDSIGNTQASLFLDEAYIEFEKGNFYKAEILYGRAYKYASKAKEYKQELVIKTLNNLGAVIEKQQRYRDALRIFDKIHQINPNLTLVWIYRALLYAKLGKYQDALNAGEKAIELGLKENDWGAVAGAHYYISIAQGSLKNYPVAIDYCRKSIQFATKAERWSIVADGYYLLGVIYVQTKDYQKAISNFKEAIKFGTRAKKWDKIADANQQLGVVFGITGGYKEAIEAYQKAIQLGRKAKNWDIVAESYLNTGIGYHRLAKYKEAIEAYQKAIQLGRKAKNWDIVAESYFDIGGVYYGKENYQDANKAYQKAIKIGKRDEHWNLVANGYINIGAVYSHLENYNESIGFYEKAINLEKKLSDLEILARAHYNVVFDYCKIDDLEKALKHGLKAIEFFRLLPKEGEDIFLAITAILFGLGTNCIICSNDKQAKKFARILVKVNDIAKKEGKEKYVIQGIRSFGSELPTENLIEIKLFRELFEKSQ